jgi:hypothetical protein
MKARRMKMQGRRLSSKRTLYIGQSITLKSFGRRKTAMIESFEFSLLYVCVLISRKTAMIESFEFSLLYVCVLISRKTAMIGTIKLSNFTRKQ